MLKWKIFYKDNITFSSDDGKPIDAPDDGVLLIVQSGDHLTDGEYIIQGGEYYKFIDNKWIQRYDIIDEPFLKGKLVSNEEWLQAKKDAIAYAKL